MPIQRFWTRIPAKNGKVNLILEKCFNEICWVNSHALKKYDNKK